MSPSKKVKNHYPRASHILKCCFILSNISRKVHQSLLVFLHTCANYIFLSHSRSSWIITQRSQKSLLFEFFFLCWSQTLSNLHINPFPKLTFLSFKQVQRTDDDDDEEITAITKRVLKPVSWRFIEFGDFTKAQTKVRKCAKCRQSVLIADKQSVLIGGNYINKILKD